MKKEILREISRGCKLKERVMIKICNKLVIKIYKKGFKKGFYIANM